MGMDYRADLGRDHPGTETNQDGGGRDPCLSFCMRV